MKRAPKKLAAAAIAQFDRYATMLKAREALGIASDAPAREVVHSEGETTATGAKRSVVLDLERQAEIDRALQCIEWLALATRIFADPKASEHDVQSSRDLVQAMSAPLARATSSAHAATIDLVRAIEWGSGHADPATALAAYRRRWPKHMPDEQLFAAAVDSWSRAASGKTVPRWKPAFDVVKSARLEPQSVEALKTAWDRWHKETPTLRRHLERIRGRRAS